MFVAVTALMGGIILLLLSADKFVDGAAATAKHLGLPPLLIGILVIGFGSSMPEMVISALSALNGNPGLALGNAIGSNITNIALILGTTALISPIAVGSTALTRELPLLLLATAVMAGLFLWDGTLSRLDSLVLIILFTITMAWTVVDGLKSKQDQLGDIVDRELQDVMPMSRAVVYLVGGLILLVVSSRIMVWGGVTIATELGISDLIIGLTIVAVGTSLPELASCIAAVRKHEDDLAFGNVIGSNLFNTSLVIGIAGLIHPTELEPELLTRDLPVVALLTVALFYLCWNDRPGQKKISRTEGTLLLTAYAGYNLVLIASVIR